MKSGTTLIKEERERQQLVEGWGPAHDDQHHSGELNDAAIGYAYAASRQARGEAGQAYLRSLEEAGELPVPWPWESQWWKPSDDPVRNLVKAGALIAAEIDRLQRMKDGTHYCTSCGALCPVIHGEIWCTNPNCSEYHVGVEV